MPASEHVSDSESSECSASEEEPAAEVNVNERRTRRGVYHVVPKEELVESDGDDSDEDVVEAGKPVEALQLTATLTRVS